MIRRWLCFVLLICLMAGCSVSSPVSGEYNGYPVMVDEELGIVCHQNDSYFFSYDNGLLKIVYPDGVEYYENIEGIGKTAGSSSPIDTAKYLPPEVLSAVIIPTLNNDSPDFPSLVMFISGMLIAIFPKGIWYLSYGLIIKNAEVTATAKAIIRVIGICTMLIAIFMMIV